MTPRLRVDGVTKTFGGLVAVDGVGFEVPMTGVTAVIGPNGAGKTTLFNLISGVFPPSAGRIVFEGVDVTDLPPHRRAASGLVRTFQLVRLFAEMTAAENVAVGTHLKSRGGLLSALLRLPETRRMEAEIAEKSRALLDLVGLGSVAERKAGTLSYGRQRLLEVARALAAEPRLLLLDEPAAGLDAEESARLAALIRRIADGGTSVLLIEHDMKLVMDTADEVVVVDFGRKIAQGSPAAVKADPAVVAAYLG